jgi:glycosyltransferase involved in cell wall biosynthesis
MAKALRASVDLTWFVPRGSDNATVRQVCATADLVIITAEMLEKLAFLQGWHRPIVVDTHPPLQSIQSPHLWPQTIDGLICASEEELQHWRNKVAPHDGFVPRDQVVLVLTGIEPANPTPGFVLRQAHPEIGTSDKVILWCGGWEPFDDPQTAIHALDRLRASDDSLKLIFSTSEDDDRDQVQRAVEQAMRLTAELGLTHAVLFVHDIPPTLQDSYLAEADVGLLLRTHALEASLREPAALAAAVEAGLPLVITDGSAGSSLVRRHGLGDAVPAGDVSALAQAIDKCLETPQSETREGFVEARKALDWAQTIAPLAELCHRPLFALDRECTCLLDMDDMLCLPPAPTAIGDLPAKAWQTLRGRGLKATFREASQYFRWKVGL